MAATDHVVIYAAAIAVVILYFVVTFLRSAFFGPLSGVPGTLWSRFTDWPVATNDLRNRRCQYIDDLHAKYGPIVRLSPNEVSISDIDAAKKVYSVGSRFPKAPFYNNFAPGTGMHNVFSVQDIAHHNQKRRLLAGPFAEGPLTETFEPQVREKAERTIERISEDADKHGRVDVFKWCLFFATDVIGQLSFGSSFDMLEQGKKNQYAKDLELINTTGALRLSIPRITRSFARLGISKFQISYGLISRMTSYATESLGRHQRQVAADPENAPPTLLSRLYALEDKKENSVDETMSFRELLMEARAYIVAGSDTTANTLTYLFYQLAKHPDVQARLSAEVNALPSRFTSSNLKTTPLLNNVIEETLRLHAAAPASLPRVVPESGLQACGYTIPPGSVVSAQAYTLHRDPTIFPSPESWDPSRWEHTTQAMKDASRPFGAGGRICIGKHLAMMELRLATALLLRRYPQGLEVAYGATVPYAVDEEEEISQKGFQDEDMDMNIHFLLSPMGKRCVLRPRNGPVS